MEIAVQSVAWEKANAMGIRFPSHPLRLLNDRPLHSNIHVPQYELAEMVDPLSNENLGWN
jgi:hypothetical protein